MNLLFVSRLFPNAAEPIRGIFNAHQVAALAKLCSVTVIAPTTQPMPDERRDGVTVFHPRFRRVPVLSRPWNGWLFSRAIEATIRRTSFDVALASWAYPDGYSLMLLARKYRFPFAVDVLGSDVNLLFKNPRRQRQIIEALRTSTVVFAKSRALCELLARHGVSAHVDYNGVDRDVFHPRDRQTACVGLGVAPERRRILFVGNLLPVKGPRVLATAFQQLRELEDVDLVFIGSGPEGRFIQTDVRVSMRGWRPQPEIGSWISASDVLCLPSLAEGLPNVAIEAMACGRPVVASAVGGVPEVVRPGVNGLLVAPGDATALAQALREALQTRWDPHTITHSVDQFDWDTNARAIFGALQSAVGK